MTLTTVEPNGAMTGRTTTPSAANNANDDGAKPSSSRPSGRRDKGFSAPSGSRRAATGATDEYAHD